MSERQYMSWGGHRYVRTVSGHWYSVHGREGTWVTNRHGTTFYRSGSEVWRDLSRNYMDMLESELHSRALKERNEKSEYWKRIIRTLAKESMLDDNPHKSDLAEMLEALRQEHFAPDIQKT